VIEGRCLFSRRASKRRCKLAGLQKVNIIKTGDQTYCIIAEWADTADLVAARPNMIATLNSFRDNLGGGLGVTDPVSGPVVLALK
jgi:hypothetical protein